MYSEKAVVSFMVDEHYLPQLAKQLGADEVKKLNTDVDHFNFGQFDVVCK